MRIKVLKRRSSIHWLRLVALVLLIVGSFCAFLAPPAPVAADPGQPGPYGRALNYGYFLNQLRTSGDDVIPGGLFPGNIDQFIIDVRARAQNWGGGWSLQHIRGAEFIVQTMRGLPGGTFPSAADIDDWEARVRSLVANGGWINFDAPISFNINSYWQNPGSDDAFFTISSGAYVWHPWNFYDGQLVGNSIAFYDSSGNQLYAIRKACGNPVGWSFSGLPNPVPYNLQPIVNASVVGAAPGTTVAEPGDTINFDFRINATTGTPSPVVNCSVANTNRTGYFGPVVGGAAPPTTCPRSFPGNSSTAVASQSVVATANTTVCRRLAVQPATPAGDLRQQEACVVVTSKPYFKVYGGDVSVGGGLETAPNTCTTNNNAAAVAWNKGTAGSYSGAGGQYAVQAMRGITDFASAQGNASGAPAPTGLSFANTATNVGSGNFGGNFQSVKCISDYYGRKPTSGVQPLSSLARGKGVYEATGNTTFPGGTIEPNDDITIYVDGDLHIANPITFSGSWTAASTPLLQIIVRGNIYISSTVTRLDGIYIAQPNGGTGGTIYTCATGFTAPVLANGAFYTPCANNKLTVNGAFIADSIEFTRTRGTLRGATAAEPGSSANIAEVFNFGPAFWMKQPTPTSGRVDNYDAITSLPPVL